VLAENRHYFEGDSGNQQSKSIMQKEFPK